MEWDGVVSFMEGVIAFIIMLIITGQQVLYYAIPYCTVPYLAVGCHLD